MEKKISTANYDRLVNEIGSLLADARSQVASSVNTILVKTYWAIGRHIVEYEQNEAERADYGTNLLNRLSKDLTQRYGKGFSRSNILYMRKLYLNFQICETLSHFLSWSHYFEILKSDDPLEISFYAKECEVHLFANLAFFQTNKTNVPLGFSFRVMHGLAGNF